MPKMSSIKLLKQNEQPIISIRTKTSVEQLPHLIDESNRKMAAYLNELNETLSDVPFVAYHDITDNEALDVEIGFPVANPIPEKGDIKSGTIPAGLLIFSMNRGPYNKMKPLHREMLQWIEKNGFEGTGTVYEYYYNDTSYLEIELLTKIIMPLKQTV
ncbi:MAG: GyrI-like domain-containing protein [Eubacteriaceae bacterium]|nr:GyrI-like domain-containing protein [Eubacteriaceae bacterium]